jgi:hypothetical protein
MAKISENERILFNTKVVPYRSAVEAILKEEQEASALLKGKGPESAIKRLEMADAMLNLASNYMVISGVSQSVQNQRFEDSLNDARKALYKSVIYVEETVSSLVDAPFSEYEQQVMEVESVSPQQRYFLIRKMGLAIQLLKQAYGDNSKWKWGFAELEGRHAVVTKNLISLKDVMVNTDPRSPHYEPITFHLRLARKLLMQSADRYREKYELSTNSLDDFKKGITYLSALKLLNLFTGARADAEIVQKKHKIWTSKLTADMDKQESLANKG